MHITNSSIKKVRFFSIFFTIFLILAIFAIANGVGIPVKKEVDNYYIEFGIEPEFPKTGEKAIMSFSIHILNGTPIEVDNFFVRISKGDRILFASTDFKITAEGPMFITYEFPQKGTYIVDVSATLDNNKIQTSFPVTVKGIDYSIIYLILALLLGILIGYLYKKKSK